MVKNFVGNENGTVSKTDLGALFLEYHPQNPFGMPVGTFYEVYSEDHPGASPGMRVMSIRSVSFKIFDGLVTLFSLSRKRDYLHVEDKNHKCITWDPVVTKWKPRFHLSMIYV